jgi:hypothetical protein
MRTGSDVELRAVGFDQRLGQGQADAGIRGLIRRRLGAERLHRGRDFVVVEAVAGIADPQHHLAEVGQRDRYPVRPIAAVQSSPQRNARLGVSKVLAVALDGVSTWNFVKAERGRTLKSASDLSHSLYF